MDSLAGFDKKVRRYLSKQADGIDGWLHPVSRQIIPTLDQVQKERGVKGDVAEIGVWHGRTLVLFSLLAGKGERVFAYDLELKPQASANLQAFGKPQKCDLQEVDSMKLRPSDLLWKRRNLATLLRPKAQLAYRSRLGFRMFHVDGSHTFEGARSDLRLAVKVMLPEGILMLDDFFAVTLPGVTQALFHLKEKEELEDFTPFALGGGKAFLCRKAYVPVYRDALLKSVPMKVSYGAGTEDQLFGEKVAIYDLW